MDLPQLASILRENGDTVLNAINKLSLSTSLLKDLNESFNLIVDEHEALNSTFQVIGTSSSKVELLLDLQFLHDFIQRTVSVKLIPSIENYTGLEPVDIRKFKNLKLLEIKRIPIKRILGLQYLRPQLQYLICTHCCNNIKEIFLECGGDESKPSLWSELKEIVLSHNYLNYIDNSLQYVPWLQSLDLSHNRLVNISALDYLINLKDLNLSYNMLEAVPLLNGELSKKIQVLVLKNNYIEDLSGLVFFNNLVTLDLSFNCLVDHQSLKTLPFLATLQFLSLEGNPLYVHPKHRLLTAERLHPNVANVKFVLDGIILSRYECLSVGTYSPLSIFPSNTAHSERPHLSSVSSNESVKTHSSELTTVQTDSLTTSQSKKGPKIRDAIIDERDDTGAIINSKLINSVTSVESLEASGEHLETRKQIDILRKKYREEWLLSVGGSLVQEVLGIPKESLPPMVSSLAEAVELSLEAHKTKSPEAKASEDETQEVIKSNKLTQSTEINKDIKEVDGISDLSTNNTFVTASESSLFEDNERTLTSESEEASDGDEPEGGTEENLHVAKIRYTMKNDETEDIFLNITEKYIKEKDIQYGKLKYKWHLDTLLKCQLISNEPAVIRLEYDTVRKNLKEREYIFDSEKEAQEIVLELNEVINASSSQNNREAIFRCMKCSCQFKVTTQSLTTTGFRDVIPECPACGSQIICGVEELTPTNANVEFAGSQIHKSPSECSIGSAESMQESNCSQTTDDNPPSENALKRYESDIEVISNPSQSSIEVLDDLTRSSRKRSSEERRLPAMPTIPDVNTATSNIPVALTESSSSSSFTESVCTAYDIHKEHGSRPESGLEVRTIQEEEEIQVETAQENEKSKSGLISSIIGGLFTGPKAATKQISASSTDDIKYNFSEDFSNIDHRIKAHLYQLIFENEHEEFIWLLKCYLFISGSTELIEICLVLSNQKVYILEIRNYASGCDVDTWLFKKDSYTVDRLKAIYTLPWKQGIGIEITVGKSSLEYFCILQNMQDTSNFLAFLASSSLFSSRNLLSSMPQQPMLNLHNALSTIENADSSSKSLCISLFVVFSKCAIRSKKKELTAELPLGVFLITNSHLVLIDNLTWLMPQTTSVPSFKCVQPISDLLELEIVKDDVLKFSFSNDIEGYNESWNMYCGTEANVNAIICEVRVPWEQIFSVPLEVKRHNMKG